MQLNPATLRDWLVLHKGMNEMHVDSNIDIRHRCK